MGVLLGPKREKRRDDVAAEGGQAMDAGMAGAADGDQQVGSVLARPAVVDGALIRGFADAAGLVVAFEDEVAVAAETSAGVEVLAVAGPAEPRYGRGTRPAGAEELPLLGARC
jgi:hypothetical protein